MNRHNHIHNNAPTPWRPGWWSLAAVALALALTVGCPQAQVRMPPAFGPDLQQRQAPGSVGEAWQRWLYEGDGAEAALAFEALVEQGAPDPMARFGAAEAALHQGRITDALAHHAGLLREHAEHPAARWSAQRLYQLRDLAPAWEATASDVVATLAGVRLPAATRGWLGLIGLEAAWRRHRASGEASVFDGTAAGFSQRWRVLGPVSLYPALDHDAPDLEITQAQAMPEHHREAHIEREATEVLFDDPFGDPPFSMTGIHFMETWLTLDRDAEVLVHLDTAMGARLWIDGALQLDKRAVGEWPVRQHGFEVKLGAGVHRFLLRVSVERGDEPVTLLTIPRDGAPLPGRFSATAPQGAAAAGQPGQGVTVWFEPLPDPRRDHPLMAWLTAEAAVEQGDPALAHRALERLSQLAPGFAPAALLAGRAALLDPALGAQTAQDFAIEAWRAALGQDPGAGLAADRLAMLLLGAGQDEEAAELLALADALAPGEPALAWHRYQLLAARGWTVQAQEALREALAADPGDCAVVAAQWGEWSQQERWPAPDALPPEMLPCDITQENLAFNHDLPRGRLDDAIARYERLVARNPRDAGQRLTLATLYQRAGREDQAREAFDQATRAASTPGDVRLRQFDAQRAALGQQRALASLSAWIEAHPGHYGLRRAQAMAAGQSVLEDLRLDGLAIVRDHLRDPGATDTSAAYLLDYAAVRIFDDGTHLTVTHTIIRVNNKEGIDRFGEVEVPDGALLLQVRTIKPDGQTLEPEPIFGKPTISMPALAPGDFIEVEYLEGGAPGTVRQGSYQGTRFYFNIYDAPLLRSEYIIDMPAAWDRAEVSLDLRQGAPEPQISSQGAWTRWRFITTEAPRAASEPEAPPVVETVPSMRLNHRFGWADAWRFYRDTILANARADHRLEAVARRLASGHGAPRQRLKAAFDFVQRNLDDDGSGPFAQPAAHALNAGVGDRLIVLKALLDQMGIDNRVVLARPWSRDQALTELPEAGGFTYALLRAEVGEEVIWLDPTLNHSLFAYLPPAARGSVGLDLGPAAELTRDALIIPLEDGPTPDMRTVSIEATLTQDGDLAGQVVETFVGSGAAQVRRILDDYADLEELERDLAGSMASDLPGLSLERLAFDGREDDQAPLVMRYRISSQGFARRDGDRLVVDRPLFATEIAARYAALPQRRLPLAVLEPVRTEVSLSMSLPSGWVLEQAPQPVALEGGFGYLRLLAPEGQDKTRVTLKRELHLPIQRVTPQDYPQFRAFAVAIDEAEHLRLSARVK